MKNLISVILFLGLSLSAIARDSILTHSIQLYLTENGQRYLSQNIIKLLKKNKVLKEKIELPLIEDELPEMDRRELLKEHPEIAKKISDIEKKIYRFFSGFRFNKKHRLRYKIEGVNLSVDFEKIDLRITPGKRRVTRKVGNRSLTTQTTFFTLDIKVRDIEVSIKKLRGQDLNNRVIGEIGVDDLTLGLTQIGPFFEIQVPVEMRIDHKGKAQFIVHDPIHNARAIGLEVRNTGKAIVPMVELFLNGVRRAATNSKSIQKALFKAIRNYIHSDAVTDLAAEAIDEHLKKLFDETLQKSKQALTEIKDKMGPVSVPKGVKPVEYDHIMWPSQMYFDYQGPFNITFASILRDRTQKIQSLLPPDRQAREAGPTNRNIYHGKKYYDAMIAVDQGLVNRIIQLGFKRGYYRNFDSDGEKMTFISAPTFHIDQGYPVLHLQMAQETDWMTERFIRGPFYVDIDLNVGMRMKGPYSQIYVKELDEDFVGVPYHFIRRMENMVKKELRKKVRAKKDDMRGYILSDKFPIPKELFGLKINLEEVDVDENGYFVFYINFDV